MAKKAKKHHLYRYRAYRRFEKKLNFVRSFDFKFESVFANDITLIIAFLKGGHKWSEKNHLTTFTLHNNFSFINESLVFRQY